MGKGGAVRNGLVEEWKEKWVTDMKILGTRTQVALREGGASLNLGSETGDDLPVVISDLKKQKKIMDLTDAEMGVSVAQVLWQFTAVSVVVHLLSNNLYTKGQLEGLWDLQKHG